MSGSPVIEALRQAAVFVVSLRVAEGYKEEEFQALVTALQDYDREWSPHDYVPKDGLEWLTDLACPIWEFGQLYKDAQERKQIESAYYVIHDLVTKCITPLSGTKPAQSQSAVIRALDAAMSKFLGSLRGGKGYQEDQFQSLVRALEECDRAWLHLDTVPKEWLVIVVDYNCAIGDCVELYDTRDEQNKIFDALSKVSELVLQTLTPEAERRPPGLEYRGVVLYKPK